jgi:hypothetical protein
MAGRAACRGEVEPWSKQHVYLYNGGDGLVAGWQDAKALRARLQAADVAELLDGRLPLVLPEGLTLSSITIDRDRRFATISAVERREHREREPSRDRVEVEAAGRTVELLAYVRAVTRGLLTFRWDLVTNTAALHITQGGSGYDYEDAEQRFARLVQPFLSFDRRVRSRCSSPSLEAPARRAARSCRRRPSRAQRYATTSETGTDGVVDRGVHRLLVGSALAEASSASSAIRTKSLAPSTGYCARSRPPSEATYSPWRSRPAACAIAPRVGASAFRS